MKITLGSSSAHADIKRGTVLGYIQRIAHAAKLWPVGGGKLQWPGDPQYKEGHRSLDGGQWYCWADLRKEWVLDYTEVIDAELAESAAWQARN